MRLLFITQKVDRADWLLGVTHSWLESLAARVDRINVICLEQGETELPLNVKVVSLGKERGVGRLGLMIGFVRALAASIGDVDGVFAHMSPVFALAAGPFAKVRRLPLVLWYTHRHVDLKLRMAVAVSDAVVSASAESFQLPTPKLRVLGHGIDPRQFAPLRLSDQPPLIVSVGRLSPIKRHELLIGAARILRSRGQAVRCVIIGAAPPGEAAYAEELRTQGNAVAEFSGAVPYSQIAGWYARSAVAINLCPTGGADKAVLEAMFCACPVVVTNQTFAPLLGGEGGRWLVAEDAVAVADAIANILADRENAQSRANAIRSRAVTAHSVDGLMDRLVDVFRNPKSVI